MVQLIRGGFALAVVAIAALGIPGCGGRTDGTEGFCDSLVGCGGDLRGSWEITAICARVIDGPSVMSGLPACDATVRHALDVTTAAPKDATIGFTQTGYAQTGTTSIDTTYVFTDACLAARGLGQSSGEVCSALQATMLATGSSSVDQTQFTFVHCTADSGTCICQVAGERAFNVSGTYRAQGSQLFFDGNVADGDDYCVQGRRAVITMVSNGMRERYTLKRR